MGNWHLHADQLEDGLQYHQQALAITQQLNDVRGQAETLDLLGLTNYYLGAMDAGTEHYARCVQLFRQLNDLSGLSASLSVMAMRGASYNLNTFSCPTVSLEMCIQEGEEAVEAARKLGWRAGEASALLYCGFALGPRGEAGRALTATLNALRIAQEIDHVQWQGAARVVLGAIYRDLLAFPEAHEHHEEVFKIGEALNAPLLFRMVTGYLVSTCVASGDLVRAEQVLKSVHRDDVPMLSIGQRLLWCSKAELALARDEPEQALEIVDRMIAVTADPALVIPRLWHLKGAALNALGRKPEAQSTMMSAYEIASSQGLLPLKWRIQLDLGRCYQSTGHHEQADDSFAGAQETVNLMANSLSDDVLRENFLRQANERVQQYFRPSPRRTAKRAFDGLTGREREIAMLIAEGNSNRAIADALILSERTVAKHVENILSKLDFSSRAQIAAWTVERGLRDRKA
ncbi:MAG: LuxR C-terminal-related transcriptional regulator [Anaerolineae bacterium]